VKFLRVRPELLFIGQVHGSDEQVPSAVKAAVKKYGGWYEGDGKDKLRGISYKGSWDDELAKNLQGYSKEFLFVIFTNIAVNKQADIIQGDGSIFDRLLKTQKEFGYFTDRKFDADTLTRFLKLVGKDIYEMSQLPATPKNVMKFLRTGERLMWETKDSEAHYLANKANTYRDKWLLSRPTGVYFVGSDHIKDLKKLHDTKNSFVEPRNRQAGNTRLI
jgi:hypothetical protein